MFFGANGMQTPCHFGMFIREPLNSKPFRLMEKFTEAKCCHTNTVYRLLIDRAQKVQSTELSRIF